MYREGHIGAALIAYAPLSFVFAVLGHEQLLLLGAVIVTGLSMLPDVDLRIPLVPHRGVTHTVHFMAVGGATGWILGGLMAREFEVLGGLFLGAVGGLLGVVAVGSHLVADALTPAGVDPFRRRTRISFDLTRSSNPIANRVLLVVGLAVVGIASLAGVAVGTGLG